MNKQTLITGLLILLILGLISFVVLGSKNKNTAKIVPVNDKTLTFFYGNTCPHCADVEKWMKENKVEEKINIVKKEVYENKQNAKELESAATICKLPTDSIGVPFLFAEGKCYIGSPDVISYLLEKISAIK
jgi:glutaredoxin